MCIQCLDASAFAKGFTECIVVLYPELLGKGACVALSVSAAELCNAAPSLPSWILSWEA